MKHNNTKELKKRLLRDYSPLEVADIMTHYVRYCTCGRPVWSSADAAARAAGGEEAIDFREWWEPRPGVLAAIVRRLVHKVNIREWRFQSTLPVGGATATSGAIPTHPARYWRYLTRFSPSPGNFYQKTPKYSPVKVQFACEPARVLMFTSGSQSEDERPFQIQARLGAHMFDALFPIVTQIIITQTVLFLVY